MIRGVVVRRALSTALALDWLPVLVVPPPQAQTLVMPPKPTPKPAPPKPDASAEQPPTPNTPPGCYYQGKTRICP